MCLSCQTPHDSVAMEITVARIRIRHTIHHMPRPDFNIRNEGTIVLFTPNTDRAKQWIAENVAEDSSWLGPALVVEHRYAGPLLEGIINAGMTHG